MRWLVKGEDGGGGWMLECDKASESRYDVRAGSAFGWLHQKTFESRADEEYIHRDGEIQRRLKYVEMEARVK